MPSEKQIVGGAVNAGMAGEPVTPNSGGPGLGVAKEQLRLTKAGEPVQDLDNEALDNAELANQIESGSYDPMSVLQEVDALGILEGSKGKRSESYNRIRAEQATLLTAITNPADRGKLYDEAYAAVQAGDADEYIQAIKERTVAMMKDESFSGLVEDIKHDPANADKSVLIAQNLNLMDALYDGPRGDYLLLADTVGDERDAILNSDAPELQGANEANYLKHIDVFKGVQDRESVQHAYTSEFIKELEGLGTVDTLLSYGGMFIADVAKDWDDLVDGNLFTGPNDVVKYIQEFRNLSPDEQTAQMPQRVAEIRTAFDNNPIKAMGVLELMFNPDPKFSASLQLGLDAAENAALVGWVLSWVTKPLRLLRAFSTTNTLKRVGNKEAAAEASVVKNIKQPKAPKGDPAQTKVGKPRIVLKVKRDADGNVIEPTRVPDEPVDETLTAAQNADPMSYEDTPVGFNSTGGLAANILGIQERLARHLGRDVELFSPADVLHVNPIDEVAAEAAIAEKLNIVEQRATEVGQVIQEARVIRHDNKGFTIQYKRNGELETEDVRWTIDDAGMLVGDTIKKGVAGSDTLKGALRNLPGIRFMLSPGFRLGGISRIVHENTRGGMSALRVQGELIKIARDIDKTFAKQRNKIHELMVAGDEYVDPVTGLQTKRWTSDDLRAGVELKSGLHVATPEEIDGYLAHQDMLDLLWTYKNYVSREHLEFLGTKAHVLRVDTTRETLLGTSRELQDIRNLTSADKVYDPHKVLGSGSFRKDAMTPEKLEQLAPEYSLVKLVSPKNDKGRFVNGRAMAGDRMNYALVPKMHDGVKTERALPAAVLNYRAGAVPRIRPPGMYYVRDILAGKTTRTFAGRKEANAYIDNVHRQQAHARLNDPDFDEDSIVHLEAHRDGELSQAQKAAQADTADAETDRMLNDMRQYGGLYTTPRATNPILMGADGVTPTRLGVDASIERYIQNISRIMPYDEYRLATIQKFKNSVEARGGFDGRDWRTADINIEDPLQQRLFEDTREYLLSSMQLAPREERLWTQTMYNIMDMMEGTKLGGLRKSMGIAAQVSPVDLLKKAAFHAHLGVFNPRQLWVQSQNAALAMSIDPVRALPAAATSLRMSLALNATKLGAKNHDELFRAASRMDDIDADDLLVNLHQYQKSGLYDSLYNNADTGIIFEGAGHGTLQSLNRIVKAGDYFFKEGENFARLIAWNIARKRFLDETKKKASRLTDDDLAVILDDTLRMNMNMQRENAASFQTSGWAGNATQFMQVQTKFVERVYGGLTAGGLKGRDLQGARKAAGWTRGEASRVLVGQTLLYGSAGVPMAEFAANHMARWFETTPAQFAQDNPEFTEFVNDGLLGWAASLAGADVRVGESASIPAGLDDNVVASLVIGLGDVIQGNAQFESAWDLLGGPSLNVAQRGIDAILSAAGKVYRMENLSDVGTDVIIPMVDDLAAISSSWSNARKVRDLYFLKKGLLTKRGKVIASTSEVEAEGQLDIADMVARAFFGLPLDIEAEYYALSAKDRDFKQDVRNHKQLIRDSLFRLATTGNDSEHAALLGYLEMMYSKQYVLKIVKEEFKAMMDPKNDIEANRKRALTNYINSGGRAHIPLSAVPKGEQ